jgi:AraC-like DNA-binding protein
VAGDLNSAETRRGRRREALWQPYWLPSAATHASLPNFERFAPPIELMHSVEFFWKLSWACSAEPIWEMVAPDADTDLIYCLGESGESLVRGPHKHLTSVSINPVSYIGVRLRTDAAQFLTGLTAGELLDRRIPKAPIDSELGDALCTAEGHDNAKVFAALARLLRRRLHGHERVADRGAARVAARLIQRSSGILPVRDIARWLGCSERHLRRTLVAAVGLSPKQYARIVRFRHAMHLVMRTRQPLAGIAADLGYTDQSHMTREFTVVAGRTPLVLRRAMSAFDKKSTLPHR